MKYCVFFLLLAAILPSELPGQRYNFTNYTISDGLAHEKITDITTDTFGNLWLATLGGGLSCFNGIEFKNYTERDGLSNNVVRHVTVDSKGNVWAATSNGISVFDGFGFRNFLMDTVQSISSVNVIESDNRGNVWFAYPSGGLGKIDSNFQIEKVQLDGWTNNDKIIDIQCDKKGGIFFVTAIQGLFIYDSLRWRPVLTNKQYQGYLLEFEIIENGLIIAGSNKGLVSIDPTKPGEFSLSHPGSFITSSASVSLSKRWLVSGGRAFCDVNGRLYLMTEVNGFTNFPISRIFADRENNIWFATEGDGLVKLGKDIFEFYTEDHGLLGQPITSIIGDTNDNIYVSNFGKGVQVFQKGSPIRILDSPLLTHVTSSVRDKQGNIWFGTRNQGVIRYDGDSFFQLTTDHGLINALVRVLFIDSSDRLWIGTANGLSIYNDGELVNYDVATGLPDNVIWGITQGANNNVIITTRNGICTYRNGELEGVNLDITLFNNRINVALQDNLGNYWLGYSGHGIVKTSVGAKQHRYITTEEGLTSDLIYNLIFDINGDLIVGSERGVDRLILDDDFELNRIKSYGNVEGINGIRTLYNSIHLDTKGDIWLGNSKGLIKYNSSQENYNEHPPVIYISGVALNYNNLIWEKEKLEPDRRVPESIKLNFNDNNLIFSFLGNSLRNPEAVTYRYRLSGLEDWSPITKKREAVYTNIPPGDYIFQVRAANSDGVWSKDTAEIQVTIVPPFWREVWFYFAVGIVVIFIIKFYNDYRIQKNLDKVLTVERIRAEELVKVRKRMARDFHDNMGNQLASITVFTNLISLKLKDKSTEVNELLTNIEKHTKSLFNGTKDFIWSIDPESDDLNEVFTYIKDFGEELFENTPIEFYSSTKEFGDLPLPSGWSRQVVLIFKEAMTNALKHSMASEVHLDLNLITDGFVIKVWDNGTGVNLESAKRGNGFRNMKTRSDQLGAELAISSGKDNKGVCIKFKATIQSGLKKTKVKIF